MGQYRDIDGTARDIVFGTSYQQVTSFGNSPKLRKASNRGTYSETVRGVSHFVPKKMGQSEYSTVRIKPNFLNEINALSRCPGFFYPLRAFFCTGGTNE